MAPWGLYLHPSFNRTDKCRVYYLPRYSNNILQDAIYINFI